MHLKYDYTWFQLQVQGTGSIVQQHFACRTEDHISSMHLWQLNLYLIRKMIQERNYGGDPSLNVYNKLHCIFQKEVSSIKHLLTVIDIQFNGQALTMFLEIRFRHYLLDDGKYIFYISGRYNEKIWNIMGFLCEVLLVHSRIFLLIVYKMASFQISLQPCLKYWI